MRPFTHEIRSLWREMSMVFCLGASLAVGEPVVRINGKTADPNGTLAFAAAELKSFAGRVTGGEAWVFNLGVDETLAPFSFRIGRHGNIVELAGRTPSETLAAAYTALEEMGYRFEVTGPVAPAKLDVSKVAESQVVTPAITRRGIRQHINFNMDVSGYPLNEAKEYIRNLARLRYNYMSYHSYPGHWTRDRYCNNSMFGHFNIWTRKAYNPKPTDLVSGGYFYGAEYRIPDHPLIRPHIRFNKEYYCVPEFEEVIRKQPERGERAQAWLRELMAETKRCGMTIHFSTEQKVIDNAYNQELAERILADYPMIDLLEFNSQEGGDFSGTEAEAANRTMAEAIITGADEAALRGLKMEQGRCTQIRNFANGIRIIRHLQAQGWEDKHKVKLVCGSYACRPDPIKLEMELAEKYLPANQTLAFMPGHSSLEVNSIVQESRIKPALLKRLLIHSWLEFDGYMMLQQQTTKGIFELANYISKQTGEPPYGIVCNHWRTAPNTMSFRYLDEFGVDATLSPDLFFRKTALNLGIPETEADQFVRAMLAIDALSDINAIHSNIGFNLTWGGIVREKRTIGSIWWWTQDRLKGGRDRFAAARAELEACRKACRDLHGQKVLDQLLTGVDCSIAHLEGVMELKPITDRCYDRDKKRMRDNLTPEDQAFIVACADKANIHFQKYLKLLSGRVSDRGEEGMLVTYYWGPVVFTHNVRAFYGKQGSFIEMNDPGNVVPEPLTAKDANIVGKQD